MEQGHPGSCLQDSTPFLLPADRPAEQGLGEQFGGPCLASAADLSRASSSWAYPVPALSAASAALGSAGAAGPLRAALLVPLRAPPLQWLIVSTQPGGQGLQGGLLPGLSPQGHVLETADAPHSSLSRRNVPFTGTQDHPAPHQFGFSSAKIVTPVPWQQPGSRLPDSWPSRPPPAAGEVS